MFMKREEEQAAGRFPVSQSRMSMSGFKLFPFSRGGDRPSTALPQRLLRRWKEWDPEEDRSCCLAAPHLRPSAEQRPGWGPEWQASMQPEAGAAGYQAPPLADQLTCCLAEGMDGNASCCLLGFCLRDGSVNAWGTIKNCGIQLNGS